MQRVSLARGENCLADPEMETGDYPGIRVYLKAECTRPWRCRSKSTSPRATASRPAPSPTTTHSCSTGGSVRLMSYPLETALAEKFETVVSRGVTSTRPRDLYDMHLLWRTRGDRCGIPTLREALESTCAKRGSSGAMARWGGRFSTRSQRAVLPYFFLAFRPAPSGQALWQAACMRRPRMRNS